MQNNSSAVALEVGPTIEEDPTGRANGFFKPREMTSGAAPVRLSCKDVCVLAVAADNPCVGESMVAEHFGGCPFYVVMVAVGTDIRALRVVANPHVADHAPGSMVSFFRNLGTDVILVGKVGPGATHRLRRFGINEITGVAGNVVDAARAYLCRVSRDGRGESAQLRPGGARDRFLEHGRAQRTEPLCPLR